MIRESDLEAAVSQNVITAEQAREAVLGVLPSTLARRLPLTENR